MAKTADVLSYLPPVFSEVYEMQAAAQGENSELNLLWQGAEDLMNDQFIDSATENGVSRWEKMLLLNPGDTDTLPERKFRIQSAMSGRLPLRFGCSESSWIAFAVRTATNSPLTMETTR